MAAFSRIDRCMWPRIDLVLSGPCLMNRQIDPEKAALLEAGMRELGVHTIAGARQRD